MVLVELAGAGCCDHCFNVFACHFNFPFGHEVEPRSLLLPLKLKAICFKLL
jgi:hypothetical protein